MALRVLSPEKRAILDSPASGVVSAGAGSGKTTLLARAVYEDVVTRGIPVERILVVAFNNAAAAHLVGRIQAEFAAGRDPSDVVVTCPVMASVGDTAAELSRARDELRLRVAFYGSTRTYHGVFDLHGWEGTADRLHELQRTGDLAGMAATITDEMLDVYTVTATWDDLADVLVERYAGTADRLVMYGATDRWDRDGGQLARWRAVTRAVTAAAS